MLSINREGTHYPHNNHLLTEEGLRNVFQSCQLRNVRFREPTMDQVPTLRLKGRSLALKQEYLLITLMNDLICIMNGLKPAP